MNKNNKSNIKRLFTALILIAGISVSSQVSAQKDLVKYVNTLQGTNSTYELSWGNTYPTTAVPYPMHAWSPETDGNINILILLYVDFRKLINVARGWGIMAYSL